MKLAVAPVAIAIGILGIASYWRLADLANRPMHADEAVQGIKFGELLERNGYEYDPREYHGPSLNYLTLPVATCLSRQRLVDVTERDLRMVPAFAGIVVVGLPWLLRRELTVPVAMCAMAMTAISTAMVFYSRYYIHEMLLVAFTFAAMIAVIRFRTLAWPLSGTCEGRPRCWPLAAWSVIGGLCIGMMHATKETCVIALFAMAVAALVTFGKPSGSIRRITGYVVLAALVSVGASATFYSSFGRNPAGVVDSITTIFHYLSRSAGEGTAGRHDYPPWYYLERLFCYQRGEGPLWTELAIGVPALAGLFATIAGRGLGSIDKVTARFLAVYAVIMTVVYAAIPYKTPWCALGFFHAMILLAAIGIDVLLRWMPHVAIKWTVIALLAAAAGQLGWQSWRASFDQFEHPGNPYVYAQTTNDVPRLVDKIEQFATARPDPWGLHIQVICPDGDYWPLPWYLRRFQRVGWFNGVPRGRPGTLIITQPALETRLNRYLYVDQPAGQRDLYGWFLESGDGGQVYLRPHVPLSVYMRLGS